jgi:hypothetical protein
LVFGKIEYLPVSQLAAFILFAFGLFVWFSRNKIIYIKKSMEEYSTK